MNKRCFKQAGNGFTIIELLCIIVVIMLLVAFLMPSLNKARSQSTAVVCMSYLHRYGQAGSVYLDDQNQMFPEARGWLYHESSVSKEHPMGCRWHDIVMAPNGEVMAQTEGFRGTLWSYFDGGYYGPCPTFRRYAPSRGCSNPEHVKSIDLKPQNSYTMNGYLGSDQAGGVRRLSQVQKTDEVFFFGEENSWPIWGRARSSSFISKGSVSLSSAGLDDTVLQISADETPQDCIATYHGVNNAKKLDYGWGNVVMLDGHVERIEYEDQIRGNSRSDNPLGNLKWAWADKETEPPGIDENQYRTR